MALRLCQIQYGTSYEVLVYSYSNFIFNFRQEKGECQVEKTQFWKNWNEWNSIPGQSMMAVLHRGEPCMHFEVEQKYYLRQ